MNCEQLRNHLLEGAAAEGAAADTPEVRAHAAECSTCHELLAARAVVEALRAPTPEQVGDLRSLKQQVSAELARETRPGARLKSLPTRARLLLALLFILAIAVVEGTLLARVDMPLVPMGHLLPVLGLLGLLGVMATWAALRPLFRRALPRSVELLLLVLCLAVPVGLSFVQPATGHPVAERGSGADLLHHAGACLVHGLTLAVLVWLAFRVLDRQALGRGLAGLIAGMGGAIVATLALQLHCAIPSAPHWLLGHASVGAVVLVALGVRHALSKRA